jgi:hypothetical protein
MEERNHQRQAGRKPLNRHLNILHLHKKKFDERCKQGNIG